MPEKMFCLRLKSRSTSGQGKRPDTLLVFITPPTAEELERRLRGRGTETEEVIKGRMERKKEEAQGTPVRLCPDQRRPRNLRKTDA